MNDLSVNIGETENLALIAVGQLRVIHPIRCRIVAFRSCTWDGFWTML